MGARSGIKPSQDERSVGLNRSRLIPDKQSWMMNLDCSGIRPSETPDYVLEISGFRLFRHEHRPNYYGKSLSMYEQLEVSPLSSDVLKYGYVYYEYSWMAKFRDRLARLAEIQVYTLPKDERPQDDRNTAYCSLPEDFQRPSWWKYWDDEFIQWCKGGWVD